MTHMKGPRTYREGNDCTLGHQVNTINVADHCRASTPARGTGRLGSLTAKAQTLAVSSIAWDLDNSHDYCPSEPLKLRATNKT